MAAVLAPLAVDTLQYTRGFVGIYAVFGDDVFESVGGGGIEENMKTMRMIFEQEIGQTSYDHARFTLGDLADYAVWKVQG